jgi:hypothetical protein
MPDIAFNYATVLRRVAAACARAGRDPKSVTVIGVTKTKPASMVRAAFDAGIIDIGENYAQEFAAKQREVDRPVRWHFIGHLQRNKVKLVASFVEVIHAVDSERLAAEIGKHARALGRRIPVLMEVNTSGEESKYGVAPEAAPMLARSLAAIDGIDFCGLMTLAAYLDDPEGTRPMFRLLRDIRDRIAGETGLQLPHLSMGMTGDFEVAIEEGATFVRIGTAIFGERGA